MSESQCSRVSPIARGSQCPHLLWMLSAAMSCREASSQSILLSCHGHRSQCQDSATWKQFVGPELEVRGKEKKTNKIIYESWTGKETSEKSNVVCIEAAFQGDPAGSLSFFIWKQNLAMEFSLSLPVSVYLPLLPELWRLQACAIIPGPWMSISCDPPCPVVSLGNSEWIFFQSGTHLGK